MNVDNPVNLLTAESRFEGVLEVTAYSHFNGQIKGTIRCTPGSTLVLGENGVVEGRIEGDTVIIDGFVRGEVHASTKIVISETGRVVGDVRAPSFAVLFGGYFQGRCRMAEPELTAGNA